MQVAIVEFARNVLNLADSNSSEFAPECGNAVVSLMEEQQHVTDMGGTMRLGAYVCRLARGSNAAEVYGVPEVRERHRHRYEVSNQYREAFVEHGLRLSGLSPDGSLVEMIELPQPSRGSLAASSIPSSGPARRVRTRCSRVSSPRRSNTPALVRKPPPRQPPSPSPAARGLVEASG